MSKVSNSIQKIFREYDIRGIFEEDLNKEVVFNIGAQLGKRLKNLNEKSVCVGYDARVHSPVLFSWLKSGFESEGIEVYNLGLIPTPVAYFATYNTIDGVQCKNSVMITGSHNPPQYNGFKITLQNAPFYGKDITALGKDLITEFSDFVESTKESKKLSALDSYISFLSTQFKHLANFPYKIAVDCGNGVAGVAIEKVLQNLHISYEALYFEPDGSFPNHHPDPSEEHNLEDLKRAMKEKNIPIGIAFDGDADRLALLSTNYSYKGDELAILFAREMHSRGIIPQVIGEVKCSQIMYDEINKIGKAHMYKTGHSNLKVKLKELGAHLAAEMSGHIFFKERYFGYDDAIYSAFRALELFLKRTPAQIEEEILALPKAYSTPEEKINTTEEQKFALIESLKAKLQNPPKDFPHIKEIISIDGLRVVFDNGWGLVRASNTTPVLVTRFEADSKEHAMEYKQKLLDLLQSCK
ncbi:phosphomannomutase/phosphoglucomutase [Helicobacter sp. MIT 00-7814]|uniref:phosphomannomutase/phosphoglucomutase n=1 Tax=unclassified Helicobacter TaxID=2593540 RepID=UPI000E1EB62C|nr:MULTISPECIES: phosphomannomutase/phosphoglucomutase [unclassified Helicobacter]RDU52279.1 phosphomannomutase/phosphoglucomutase [Helicobacter sp. MIT 00-7814]RDU52288.1 phosphomannomutase/phosphoglucomutase [Helicobacter sp. MIT 99-10781]